MPEVRYWNGNEIKHTKRIVKDDGNVLIRVTLKNRFGQQGYRITATPEQYNQNVTKKFVKGSDSHESDTVT